MLIVEIMMLGLGYIGGFAYLMAYLCLTKGWISGTGYVFHGASVISCAFIAVSSGYSQAWPSALLNIIFVVIGALYLARKAIQDSQRRPNTLVNAADLTFETDGKSLDVAA